MVKVYSGSVFAGLLCFILTVNFTSISKTNAKPQHHTYSDSSSLGR